MEFGVEFIKMLGALSLVLAVLVGALFALKKAGKWVRKPDRNDWIQVVAQHPIGIKHHLVLVRVREELLLVGVSPQGMHLLSPSRPAPATGWPADLPELHPPGDGPR